MTDFANFDPKDPDATRFYTWDFSDWLDTGESISSYTFPSFPAGLTQVSDSNDTTSVTVKISGGTAGESYDIICRVVTDAGQTDDKTLTLPAEVKQAQRQLYRYEREIIPKAISRSVNTTMRNTTTAVNRYMAAETGLKIKDIKGVQFQIRSTPRTLFAMLITRKRPYNLRRFVTPSKLKIGGFVKSRGVIANPWKRRRLFYGAFIMRGKTHGQLIVVKRSNKTRSGIKGMYGPSVYTEIQRKPARDLITATVRKRFGINFARDLNYYASRI